MKKVQKFKTEEHLLLKPLSFDERFKNKKNILRQSQIGSLLGVREPFQQRKITPMTSEGGNSDEQNKFNPEQIQKSSKLAKIQLKTPKAGFSSQEKQSISRLSQQRQINKSNLILPKITKSSVNLVQSTVVKEQPVIPEHIKLQMEPFIVRKRANSQLSCINLIKVDSDANKQWKKLMQFQRLNNFRMQKIQQKLI